MSRSFSVQQRDNLRAVIASRAPAITMATPAVSVSVFPKANQPQLTAHAMRVPPVPAGLSIRKFRLECNHLGA